MSILYSVGIYKYMYKDNLLVYDIYFKFGGKKMFYVLMT